MQRAHYSKRRKEIWEALHPEPSVDYGREDGGEEEIQVGQLVPPEIGYKKPPPQVQSFAAATAEVTGQSKRDINRNVARAEAIGDDLLRLTGTSLDKGYKQYLYPSQDVQRTLVQVVLWFSTSFDY